MTPAWAAHLPRPGPPDIFKAGVWDAAARPQLSVQWTTSATSSQGQSQREGIEARWRPTFLS